MSSQLTQAAKASSTTPATVQSQNTVSKLLERQADQIAAALPRFMDPDHFRRVILTEVRRTPKLMQCDPMTVIASCMLAAQLGLEPGPLGQCYLIPRKNKGRQECQFQWGYKGLLAMAHRSGDISDITVEVVYENDDFSRRLGDDAEIYHKPAEWGTDRGKPIGYYAVLRTKNGGTYRDAMSRQEIEAHARKFSDSYGKSFSPWNDHFDEMAKKTLLKRVLKLAPMSIDFARGIETDGAAPQGITKDMADLQDVDMGIIDVDGETVPDDQGAGAANVQE